MCCHDLVFLQVRRVFWKLLELCPTPEAAIAADTAAIRDIIAPLGLHNKRAVAVQKLSQDFVQKEVGNCYALVLGDYVLLILPWAGVLLFLCPASLCVSCGKGSSAVWVAPLGSQHIRRQLCVLCDSRADVHWPVRLCV